MGTEQFKAVIKSYLDKRAEEDKLFAKDYTKAGKSIDECIKYIINEVRKSGKSAFADDEIYSIAVHYYNEDNLGEIKDIPKVNIVTPAAAKKEHIVKKEQPKKRYSQMSLFNF